jgi:hypothetical protein
MTIFSIALAAGGSQKRETILGHFPGNCKNSFLRQGNIARGSNLQLPDNPELRRISGVDIGLLSYG